MPGGSHVKIPRECVDARGAKRPLFNPAVRRGGVIAERGLHFPKDEFRRVLNHVGPPLGFRRLVLGYLLPLVGVGVVFSVFSWIMFNLNPAQPRVAAGWIILMGCFPPFGAAALYLGLKTLAENTWGVVAFTGEAGPVVEAMLSVGRCPSCAYPLGNALHSDGCVRCSECGGVWKLGPDKPTQ